mgnify:CR=1 FL=1
MTETVATKRLNKVAVEFNVAIPTIVEFLNSKGIEIDPKPTSKVSDEAYEALLQKFQPDKLVKQKSDSLKLTQLIHKEEKRQPAPPEPHKGQEVHVAPVHTELEKEPEKAEPELVHKPAEAEPKPHAPVVEPKEEGDEDTLQLRVVGKMDLEALKPKKKKKEEEPAAEAEIKAPELHHPEAAEVVSPPEAHHAEAHHAEVHEVEEPVHPEKEEAPVHHVEESKTEVKQEEHPVPAPPVKGVVEEEKKGLTIVGKIDLEQFNKPKKKPLA